MFNTIKASKKFLDDKGDSLASISWSVRESYSSTLNLEEQSGHDLDINISDGNDAIWFDNLDEIQAMSDSLLEALSYLKGLCETEAKNDEVQV